MSLLNVVNVSHHFGGRDILKNANFRLLKGEHVGIVGANGEGKSTFINIILGNELPSEGKIEWAKHLDVLAKESLQEAINNYKGTILLVCHEADFFKLLQVE